MARSILRSRVLVITTLLALAVADVVAYRPLGAPRPQPASALKFPGYDAFSTNSTESAPNSLWNDNILSSTGHIRRDPQTTSPTLAPGADSSPTLAPGAEHEPTLAPGAEHSPTLPAGVTGSQAAFTSNPTYDDECICEQTTWTAKIW